MTSRRSNSQVSKPRNRPRRLAFERLEERLVLDSATVGPPVSSVLGRTPSSYSVAGITNNQLTVTYTVYNQRAEDLTAARVTTRLQPGVSFSASTLPVVQNGPDLAWTLGTIPAYGRASVAMTVVLAGAQTLQIDSGAQSSVNIDGGTERTDTPALVLNSQAIQPDLLAATPDASAVDAVIQEQAARLRYDPQRLFDFLNDDVGYESYVGSLRGARGTLWSEAGNSLDEASLGVALARASGIPARYARGTLSDARAQELILSMFPASAQTVGYISSGAKLADPANDPTLLAETRDHYWFQFDIGNGFQDADTSGLSGGALGTAFATVTDTFTAVADALRHKVHVSLDAETYSQAAAAFGNGNGLTNNTVLDRTFNAVDLVGKPLSVGQFVSDNNQGGLAFLSRAVTYTPYFLLGDTIDPLGVNDDLTTGTPFEELLTNFPLGSTVLTGLKLNMDLLRPGGVEHHERALVDRIGYAARQGNATMSFAVDANGPPALSEFDKFTLSLLPGECDPRDPAQLEASVVAQEQYLGQFAGLPRGSLPADYEGRLRTFILDVTRLLSIRNNAASDDMTDVTAKRALVRAYAEAPRLVLLTGQLQSATATGPGAIKLAIDLRRDTVRVVSAPGQAPVAAAAFNIVRGIAATQIEKVALASALPPDQQALTINTDNVLQTAAAQGVPVVLLTPDDLPNLTNRIAASPDAQARISEALTAGQFVIAPERPVTLGTIQTTSWYEVDPLTGLTVSVGEDGGHPTAVEYGHILTVSVYGFLSGVVTFGFGTFVPEWKAKLALGLSIAGSAKTLVQSISTGGPAIGAAIPAVAFFAGFSGAFSLMSTLTGKDPPAEGAYWDIEPQAATPHFKSISISQSATAGQPLRIVPAVSAVAVDQNTPASIPFTVVTDVAGDYTITAMAPEGWPVTLANNAVSVAPAPGTQGGTGTVRLVVRSKSNADLVSRAEIDMRVTPTAPGLTFDVIFDPAMTVPFQGAQLPTGYQALMRNLGPAAERFNLTFTGVTPGWEVITTGPIATIPAGTTGILGVYLRPTGTVVPGVGANVSFTATASSSTNPALTQSRPVAFAMPQVAATVFTPNPRILGAFPDSTASTSITVRNFGNADETVTLSADSVPAGITVSGLPQTLTLAPGQSLDVPCTLTVAASTPLNTTAYVRLSLDKAPTGAVQPQSVDVALRVVVPGAEAIANAAQAAAQLGQTDLADRLDTLTIALTTLVGAPTDAIANSQAVAALDAVISIIDADPVLASLYSNSLTYARNLLAAATTTPEVQTALDYLASNLTGLGQTLTDLVKHGFTFGLATNVVTALPGVPARFPILLENKGTEPTTFDLSIGSLPFDVTATFDQTSIVLQPGERADGGPGDPALNLSFTGGSLFPSGFTVFATPQEAPGLAARTSGSVAVRSEFVQVAAVVPAPAFTQPGGSVSITARILNAVNRQQAALVSYRVTDANGTPVFTSNSQAVTLGVQTSLIDVVLPSFSTAGFTLGDYTVTVTVTDATGTPIPGGTGQTALLVGSPVSASITVSPEAVLAPDATVTNTLQLDAQTAMPNPLTLLGQVQTTPTATTILVSGAIAYVAGTNGIDIVNIADPAAPQVVGTFGQGLIVQGGFTVVRPLSGDRILVATRGFLNANSFTLLTYSVANPTAPVLLGQSTVGEAFISDLFVVGSRALATTNGILFIAGNIISQFGDVLSLDLTDPAAVTVTDELFGNAADDFNQNGGEVVDASTLYVASTTSTGGFSSTQQGNGLVRVIDYSDPANLSQIRQVTIPGTVQVLEIAAQGNRALVVGSTGGWKSPFLGVADAQLTGRMTLTLLDITDRRNPIVLGTTLVTESLNRPVDTADGGAKLSTLALGNGKFAVSRGYVDGKPVLLLADTTGDQLVVAAIEVPSLVNEMAIVNDTLYTTSQSGLLIYNVGAIEGMPVTVSVQVPNSSAFPNVNRVRANSFNIPPDEILAGAGFDTLVWTRPLAFGTTSSALTWQTDISGLAPGESRDVTTGTEVSFVRGGTPGSFTLAATSVVGRNAVAIDPAAQTVAPGAPATYAVTLTNPTSQFLFFTLSTLGVPASWVDLPRSVFVDAQSTTTVTLRITAPAASPNGSSDFVVFAAARASVVGTAQATLTLVGTPIAPDPDTAAHGIMVSIAPAMAIAGQGTSTAYVVRLTNTGSQTETFALSSVLPAGVTGVFESTVVTVPAGTSNYREITLLLTPDVGTAPAQYPFTATAASTTSNATNTARGEVQVVANGVGLAANATTGTPGDTFLLTVTNTGTIADTFALSLAGAAGVVASLSTNSVTLSPGQSQVVTATTAAITNAVPGSRDLVFAARSTSVPAVVAAVAAALQIAASSGLDVQLDRTEEILSVPGSADFVVMVANTGNTEDAYTATIIGTQGPISASLIGLNGQPTQTLPIFRLPGLSTGAIRLLANLTAAGQGDVTIQVQSLNDVRRTARVTAAVKAPVVANHAPQAKPDVYQTNEDTALDVPVNAGALANDSDGDQDLLHMRVVQPPLHGTLTPRADGSFRYVPEANFNGVDRFQYVANDGRADSDAATVTITVHAVDDPLVLQGRTFLAPGMASELITVRFDWLVRKATYNNEVGIVLVDDANGRIGKLKPGDPGYLQAALAPGRWQRVFRSGQGAGAATTLTLHGGARFMVYLVQNGRTEDALLSRPPTRRKPPRVFFMLKAANPDRFDHVRIAQKKAKFQLSWEDRTGGGDRDFNDVVLALRTIANPSPRPVQK